MNKKIVFLLALFSSTLLAAKSSTVPLEHYAKLPVVKTPMLSTGGKRIASTVTVGGKPIVVVNDVDTLFSQHKEPPVPISSGDLFFNWYQWANDERLVVNLRKTVGIQAGLWNISRLATIGHDGKDVKVMKMRPNDFNYYRQNVYVINWLKNDDRYILAALNDKPNGWATPEVDKVDVYTGKNERILKSSRGIHEWIADATGEIRIGVSTDTKFSRRNVTVYYRENESAKWKILQQVDYFDRDRLTPHRFVESDPNILLVSSDHLDELYDTEIDTDEVNLYEYDLSKREVVKHYKDTYREKVISIVQNALPDLEVEIVSNDYAKSKYVFRVFSDNYPPEYYLLDVSKPSLDHIGSEYPQLENVPLAKMESVSYKARDGLEIPAFLTIPVGAKKDNLPLVVYPHGGPWSHDEWGFDNYVQFMASRGYAVFQPQFRGSTGYGLEHETAGYKQWGYAIQDDITDGVQWLIDEGVVDPKRVCIVGSSFGGYAAAVGIAKTPELYQCAVSINGVLNLKSFISSGRQLLFKTINRAMWNSPDEAEAASPYHLVDNIKAPLMLIAGSRDTVVPYKQSKKMYKKMKKAGKDVELIKLTDGEHWRTNEKHEIKKMKALERFLDEHIGG